MIFFYSRVGWPNLGKTQTSQFAPETPFEFPLSLPPRPQTIFFFLCRRREFLLKRETEAGGLSSPSLPALPSL